MKVVVAKTAGFCFGVRRAVEKVYEQVKNGCHPIYTYGPIIHNESVVDDLQKKGVHVLQTREELETLTEGTVVIRSHGVEREIYDLISRKHLHLVDATCPYVKKIHKIVERESQKGCEIVIIGNPNHPEVQGIKGWSVTPVTIIETEEEAEKYENLNKNPVCIVSQTTFNYNKFNKLVEIISKKRYDIIVLNTICSATEERQTEAKQISAAADCMIVIGGKQSSNTQKLFEICKKECENTYYIQTLDDLDATSLPSMGCVGITAGASTPNNIIEEVQKKCQI
ncbi:MAG: 4-hydroxy-3-methylbut-2-enyl diphosphate reductase [Lachnospiraceae bacterium]|nr:4-hydroxy-3-methylbut-2-enyl diphosphate reductase [Robinsoniella sp.]MDY3766131.1 4-hydroxy-3-methylbut-2-enyl diphosphate reductase [Lachnospiraceae bacterium]